MHADPVQYFVVLQATLSAQERATVCVPVYVPAAGDAVVVGAAVSAMVMVTFALRIGDTLPAASLAQV